MGLFERYPAPPGSVQAEADAIQATAIAVTAVAALTNAVYAPATPAVTGLLVKAVVAAITPVKSSSQAVEQSVMFAAACTRYWGDAIETYNVAIDALNAEYDTAVANDFGYHAPSLLDAVLAGDLDGYRKDRQTFNTQVSAARSALIAELTRRKNVLEETLDEEAATIAGWLAKGPTDAALVALMQAGALPFVALRTFPGVDFSAVDMNALINQLGALGRSNWLQLGGTSAELKALLDLMREDDVDPREYKDLLQQYWLVKACEKAGIDLAGWDPTLGADAMEPYLVASYEYYAQLYLDNPNFQWAGMAAMIGPTFGGGMFDLQMLRQLANLASAPLDHVPGWLLNPVVPGQIKVISVLGDMSEEEFAYFETTFLSMQKQIFTDQVPMHEAYLEMGLDGIQEMRDAGLIDDNTLTAWKDIDYGSTYGDPELVASGNAALLYREQHDIIGDDYDAMRDYHGPVGEAMTYIMGAIGSPGIPGAQTLAQHDPLTFSGDAELPVPWLPNPYGQLTVETPLPAGNISDFDTRWDLIESDTLPAFQDLMKNHPAEVAAILNADVSGRIDDARLVNNIDDLIARLSDFDVDVEIGTR